MNPPKHPAGTASEGSAQPLEDALAAWKAAWAQANKAGVRGSQYFAGPTDTVSRIAEKTKLLKDAIKAKQSTTAGK